MSPHGGGRELREAIAKALWETSSVTFTREKSVMGFQVTWVLRPWMSCEGPDMEPGGLRGPATGPPTLYHLIV